MKKVIFGTALASMALLSACSSDNELANVGTTANNAIGFHVVGNKAETRAKIVDNSNINSTDFNVFAFTRNEDGTDGNFFMGEKENEYGQNGIKIDHTQNDWNYANAADIHYWPTSTALNFYAVNPAKVADNMFTNYHWSIKKDTKTITYSCCDEYGNRDGAVNYDVMYAIAEDQTKDNNAGKVNFQFKHILSQVVFKAKTQLENMEVEIKEIKIVNPQMQGTYTLPTTSSEKGTWALAKPAIGSNYGKFTVVKEQNIKVTSTGANISENTPMLFVPQTLNAWKTNAATPKTKHDADADHEAYLSITCKIKQEGVYVFDGTLYVPFGPTWEQGKRYTYTLIFGGGYDEEGQAILQPINFTTEVDTWKDANATEIDVNQ